MSKQAHRKKLILNGLSAPAIMIACAILASEKRLFANPMIFFAVLAVSLLIGATFAEFFSVKYMMPFVLVLIFAGGYFFVWVFPWDSVYFIIFFGGLIGGLNFGLLSPKRFIIK